MAEAEKEVKIKCVRSDRGGEFTFEEFKNLCEKSGIKNSVPFTLQENDVVERKDRTIMGLVRSTLQEKKPSSRVKGRSCEHVCICAE